MSENNLDLIIKKGLKVPLEEPQVNISGCLADDDVATYVSSVMADEPPEGRISRHINECGRCFDKAASALAALASFDRNLSDAGLKNSSLGKAKLIPRTRPPLRRGMIKRNRFLLIAALFFILSFILSRYFLQFLAAALIFGLKWVMDTGGSKAMIMIYETWQQKKGAGVRQNDTKDTFLKQRR